jgi:solute:Na+ symporter, SSS family
MNLSTVDIAIVIGYLLLTFSIGYYMSKRATNNLSGYFLGGNKIKWWMLGLSNSSGMFDVNAVSWRLGLLLMYGIQSVWIPWVWPVWNQVFVMIFLSTWLRRSGAMTGAEWMRIRFGDGIGGRLSHIIVVVFAVVEVIISIGVFFTGIGGLVAELLPNIDVSISNSQMISSKTMYAIILCLLTTIYSIKGGIFSIVATEVLQFIILTICCFVVIYLGMTMVSTQDVASFIPAGWLDFWPKGEINYNWPKQYAIIENESVKNGYKMIAGMVGLMIGKGLIASIAGPVPGFDMQRSLSSQSPKDAAKMSGFTILVLFIPLYFMVGGFALLAIKQLPQSIGSLKEVGNIFNVLVQQLPIGVKGLVIAGLLAAFMSVFSAFVNVAPAYVVNDLYKRYLEKNKSDKHYVMVGKWVSLAVVVIGILIGTQITSLNEIILFVVGAYYGAYAAPNMLKWIWWRFNGYGYFAGMMCGMIAAMFGTKVIKYIVTNFIPSLQSLADTQAVSLMAFVFIFVVSIVACIVGSLLTQPVDDAISKSFYAKTKPWGFWQPVIYLIKEENTSFNENKNFKRDAINVLVGIVWQMSMVVMPLYVAFRQWNEALIGVAVLVGTSLFLKFNWYNKLEEE